MIPETGLPVQQIALALLEFTTTAPGITPLHVDILRVIVVVLENMQTPDPLALLREHIEHLAEVAQQHKSQALVLTNTAQELKDTLDNRTEYLEKCAEKACNALQETANVPEGILGQTNQRMAYAGMVKMTSPSQHREILAKSEALKRQVLINSGPNQNLHDLTEKELVAKANIALMPLKNCNKNLPKDMTLYSARKLCNRAIIFEVD
ncbi:hypothetical protein BS17DRAFT_765290 [Gyrodon lividus]|nr:hypothetical protein BS17DRAFT_765290 [Gyrodon lividus]